MSLSQRILTGDRLALARLLTRLENLDPEWQATLAELYPRTGRAHLIGITGPPGVGKSSLVNALARAYRHPQNGTSARTVAVVAVDPTSPFTGGAILGDRIRMRDLAGDPGVFIRSMATRGALGGLARATAQATQAMDAAGFDVILIETVGAGQSEVEIAGAAHTVVVVEAPGMGDDVQAIKAGILEIADVLAVNKCDLPGAENTVKALRGMLELAHPARRTERHHGRALPDEAATPVNDEGALWLPPVVKTIAGNGEGVAELQTAIERHRQHLQTTGGLAERERARAVSELEEALRESLWSRWQSETLPQAFEAALESVLAREMSPAQAVNLLLGGGKMHDRDTG